MDLIEAAKTGDLVALQVCIKQDHINLTGDYIWSTKLKERRSQID